MRSGRFRFALLAVASAIPVRAEPVYVIEQLVVSVAGDPDGQGDRIATVKSGDKLELLERQRDEAHVRLPNGSEGWIRSSYVSTDPPLQQRLADRSAEVVRLKQETARLETELAAARSARAVSAATPPSSGGNAKTAAGAPTQPASQSPSDPAKDAATASNDESLPLMGSAGPAQLPWRWILCCSATMLVVGFLLGWRVLDGRIRRKYGGLRPY